MITLTEWNESFPWNRHDEEIYLKWEERGVEDDTGGVLNTFEIDEGRRPGGFI